MRKNLLTYANFLDKIKAKRIHYFYKERHGSAVRITTMDEMKNNEELQEGEVITYTLTDDEGNEYEFELLATGEVDNKLYYALAPVEDDNSDEYVIFHAVEDDEGVDLTVIEDDDEWDKVADYFDDLLFGDVDYDA